MKLKPLHVILNIVFIFTLLNFNNNSFAQVCFMPAAGSPLTTGSFPESAKSADFNNDGKLDIACANQAANSVSIFIGNGTGGFSAAVGYLAGTSPSWVTSGDFNVDGNIDLAVSDGGTSSISILLGSGTGTFSAPVSYTVGSVPTFITTTNINNDGILDLAVANNGGSSFSVLLGVGNGTFGSAITVSLGAKPYSVTCADFNADGNIDIAAPGYGTNTVSILLGNGNGTFATAVNYATGTGPFSVINADFNNDGFLDLVVSNLGAFTSCILLGNGDGTFDAAVNFNTSGQSRSLVSVDVNADGNMDVAATASTLVSIMLGDGAGAFKAPVIFTVGSNPHCVTLGDFNADGKPDLALPNYNSNSLSILLNSALPAVTANSTVNSVCTGGQVTLTGGGANSYVWTGGATNGVALTPSGTTTYTVTGKDAAGCTNTSSKTITVNTYPTVTANSTATTVCAGTSITLTGGGAISYSWTGGVTNGTAFIPSGSNTYTVTGTTNGCSSTATKSIIVNALPVVTANTTATSVCAGTSITLTGGGADTYTWTGGVTDGVAFIPTGTNTYTVTGTNTTTGCSKTATKLITVKSLPTVTANTTANNICAGTSITLSGGGANTYTWTGGLTNGVSFIPSGTDTYTVTGTSTTTGCSNTATKTITVNPLPTIIANSTANAVCPGISVTLTGSGANTYVWTGGINDGVSFIPSATNTYTVTGTNTATGCSNTSSITITVNSIPAIVANTTSNAICSGDQITLSGSGAVNYTWTNAVINGIAFSPIGSNTYTVTGTDGNGCSNTATVNVIVNTLPNVTSSATLNILCAGDSTVLTGGGALTYNWSNGIINGISFIPSGSMTYTVTGSDGTCSNTSTQTITVNQLPIVIANNSNAVVCQGNSVILTGSGASSYVWSGGITDGTSFTPSSSNSYTVSGTDGNGCINSASASVTVLLNSTGSQTVNLCNGESLIIGSAIHTTSGIYIDTTLSSNSCDSIITTDLTVADAIDVSTSTVGINISSNQSGAIYQWLDCDNGNSIINGATDQNYIPLVNGNYSVIVSLNSCSDTSVCVNISTVGLSETADHVAEVSIYPNPTKDISTLEYTLNSDAIISLGIYNVIGVKIADLINNSIQQKGSHKFILNKNYNNLSSGIYFVTLIINGNSSTKRLVITE